MTPFDGSGLCFIPLFILAVVGVALFGLWDKIVEWGNKRYIEKQRRR